MSNPALQHGSMPSHPQPMQVVTTSMGETKKIKASKMVFKDSIMKIDQISSQSTFGLVWANQNNVTFDIKDTSVCFAKRILIQLVINNLDGTNAATLVNTPFLLSQIAFYANGSDNVANLYPEFNWYGYTALLDIEQATELASIQGWNPPLAATNPYTSKGITIAASGQTTLYLEVGVVLDQLNIPIHSSVSNPYRIQAYFAPSPYASNSAGTNLQNLSLQSAQMFVIGEMLSSKGLRTLQKEMAEHHHEYAGYMGYRQILNVGAITSTTQINQTLSGLEGCYAGINTFLRVANAASGAAPEEQYQFNYTTPSTPSRFILSNLALLKGDGSPLFVNNLPDGIMRASIAYLYTDSVFASTFAAYNWWFSTMPVDSLERGYLNHYQVGTNWVLRAQGTASVANTELVILGWKFTTIKVGKNRSVEIKFPGSSTGSSSQYY